MGEQTAARGTTESGGDAPDSAGSPESSRHGDDAPQGDVDISMYGRYEVLGRLAAGSRAEFFLGRETTSVGASRNVVIERILPHVADDDQFVQGFLDEARLAIQLNHPNLCHIYEFGELEGSYFIAMEWVNGVSLGKLIRRSLPSGGVPPEIAVGIIAQVAEALHHAHRAKDGLGREMGIVHQDVSPTHVMVAYDGQVKLLDFGIAKAATHLAKTGASVVMGRCSYMAPEQCLGEGVDARADVFALGLCLFEALSGKSLYWRESQYETMRAVVHEAAPSLRSDNAAIPEELDRIVLKALEKDREDRYENAGAMQHDLERWLASAGKVVTTASVAALMEELYADEIARGPRLESTAFGESSGHIAGAVAPPSAGEVTGPSSRRSPWMLALFVALVLALGLGFGYAFFG